MPASHLQTLRAMAYNNAWANHRLLSACAAPTQEEFEAPRIGFFPSIQATLNHILTVDLFYVDALGGGTLGPDAWVDPIPCPTLEELRVAQATVDRRLIAWCDALDENGPDRIIRVHRGTRVQTERADRLLLHLFPHDVHHRGQAHAMLSGTDVKRRSSTSSSRSGKRHCGRRSSRNWAGRRLLSGASRIRWGGGGGGGKGGGRGGKGGGGGRRGEEKGRRRRRGRKREREGMGGNEKGEGREEEGERRRERRGGGRKGEESGRGGGGGRRRGGGGRGGEEGGGEGGGGRRRGRGGGGGEGGEGEGRGGGRRGGSRGRG